VALTIARIGADMSVIDKKLVITMEDNSKWSVPVRVIAENRAKYYQSKSDLSFESCMEAAIEYFEDEYEIEDWAANNMNWSDVEDIAQCLQFAQIDMEDGWCNGDKEIID